MSTFRKYDKIYRLGTSEADGILRGTVYIAPKLDGTNGSIWCDFEGIQYGSRNHKLGEGADNAGFKAALKGDERVYSFFETYPTFRLYGEWLVPHTIKGYVSGAWKRFYVFDVYDGERFLTPREWEPIISRAGLDYIHHYALDHPTMEEIELALTIESKKYMEKGEIGEGIVLKNFDFINRFGVMSYAKYINEGFQSRPKKVAHDNLVEDEIAYSAVTPGLVQKVAKKILTANDTDHWDRKTMIPRLIETVYHDVITERLYDKLKDMGQPIVNFKLLRGSISRAIKDNGKEFF